MKSTIDEAELNRFAALAQQWWDPHGPLKTLHDINPARIQFMQQHLINLAPNSMNQLNILDLGCGGGVLSEEMARWGARVVGIDAEPDVIEVAKEHAQTNQLDIDYQATPVEHYQHNGFDVITCLEMLEHVSSPELILEHCRRLLKPNGLLFLSTINRTSKAYAQAIIMAEYVLNLLPKQTHDFKKFIQPSELMAMGRSLGFSLVGMSGLKYNPFSRTATLQDDVSVNYLLALQL